MVLKKIFKPQKNNMMKKFLLAAVFTAAVFTAANAQVMATTETKTMTKEEKAAAKAKKEAELNEAFTTAGLTDEEQVKMCRAALDQSNEKSKVIRADAALTADDKKAKLDAVNKERNEIMKTIMGDAKYKIFKATQKAQKEAAGATAN